MGPIPIPFGTKSLDNIRIMQQTTQLELSRQIAQFKAHPPHTELSSTAWPVVQLNYSTTYLANKRDDVRVIGVECLPCLANALNECTLVPLLVR